MKTSKRVISLVLAAIMVMTSFAVGFPNLKIDTEAAELQRDENGNIIIDGVTQKQIVTDTSVYDTYTTAYLNGAGNPTDIIIPGLDPAQDYVIQGMTYYPERDWMLVTAYHNVADGETTQSSKIFALDAATGEFVAMFSFINLDGTTANTDHGGGIACSEHNIYYSCGDKDRKIAYAPLDVLKNAEVGKHTAIQLVDEVVLHELGDAYTAYVCYDEGILWTGNFYDKGTKIAGIIDVAADYNGLANARYNSMVFGYKLAGNSSEEEWAYLEGRFQNLLTVSTASGSGTNTGSTCTWKAYQNGGNVSIVGNITAPTAYVGEFTGSFGSFTLTEGVNYTIEFTSTNNLTDMYMFAPNGGGHCNVKQSSQTTITQLDDGRYHYEMNFTAGLKPASADSTWPTTKSTDGTYTGTYTVRFDQDAIQAGETREFEITNVKIAQTNSYENAQKKVYDEGSAGSPTYALGLNNALKDVQYAVVDNGKLYLSRSYGSGAGNSVSFGFGDSSWLSVADIDLSVPGNVDVTLNINGTTKNIKAYDISQYTEFPMMPMSEGLCVVNDNIFITFEGASNKYKNESDGLTSIGNCTKPVDVVWQLDPYELMETTVVEPEASIYYEKVDSLSEIKDGEEYIIIHQSPEKDPVTQQNIIYAINADGGLKGHKLSKGDVYAGKGYNAMLGHPITEYAIIRAGETDSLGDIADKDRIYLDNTEKDDVDSIRWTLNKIGEKRYSIKTTESYFANCNSIYFDQSKIGMAPSHATYLSNMAIQESGNGNGGFWISNAESYYLWCNDGLSENYNKKITSFYIENGATTAAYSGIDEQDGTFHCDALNTTNIIGQRIQDDNDRVFYIYKRVKDDISSTYESRVYTDLNAELQEDGTYTIDLETYAISPYHYQYVGERPTDYIIVADTSSSMTATGSAGIISYPNGTLNVNSFIANKEIVNDKTQNAVNGYAFSKPEEELYYMHTDGRYYHLKLAIHSYDLKGLWRTNDQRYWVYYVTDDGLHYILQNDSSVLGGFTYQEFINNVDNGQNYTKKSSNDEYTAQKRYEIGMLNCNHYRFADDAGEFTRFSTLKDTVERVSDHIISQNSQNRIACVRYGADDQTAYFSKGTGNWATSVPTSNVNAFYNATELSGAVVASILDSTSAQTSNEGIELKIASEIVKYSGIDYSVDGERNLAVIFISDGIPGSDGADAATAKNAANKVISYASEIKKAGGFIYTIVMGQDSSFDRNTYMQAVSSTYAEATRMDSLGGRSVDGINYNLNLSACNLDYFMDIGLIAMNETIRNGSVGLSNLDNSAIIRQELSESFKFDEASYNARLVEGNFDAIGRFSFDEENTKDAENEGVVVTPVDGLRYLTITGYNYASEYIGNGKSGRKLHVRITGVLADENAVIQNTSIANTDTAAIYNGDGIKFRKLPTAYFNIPEYTYVLDYGIQMYDYDVNGTLKSVESDLSAIPRNADGTLQYRSESENGLVTITNKNQDLIYKSTPTNFADSGYCLIQREDGTYDWFEIKVVPASNVLFEENYIENKSGSTGAAWSKDGETKSGYQKLTNNDTDVYGYDDVYDTGVNAHSYGSADKVTVSTNTKRSVTKTFDFIGDGIDLISACGANTGVMIVKISGGNLTSPRAYIVDTYYGGQYAVGDFVHQTPIVSFRAEGDNAYGTYTVEVTAAYLSSAGAVPKSITNSSLANGKLSGTTGVPVNDADVAELLAQVGMEDIASADVELVWFDDNSILNGGTGAKGNVRTARDGSTTTSLDCYLDGFRVYNPLNDDSSLYKSSEKGAVYYNVIDHLQNSGVTDADLKLGDIAYVINDFTAGEDGSIPALSFGNYQNIGPQDEFYLKNGATDGLAFKVSLNTPDSRVQLGLRAVTGTAKVKIGVDDPNTTDVDESTEFEIKTATEMYYDITEYLTKVEGGTATITIQNTGDTVLAVNNVKVTGEAAIATIEESELEYAAMMMASSPVRANVVNGVVTPVTDDATEPDDGNTSIPGGDVIGNAPSFVQELLAKLFEILSQVFAFLPVGEVM